MFRHIIIYCILLSILITSTTFGQEQLEVEGAITIQNSASDLPPKGTIRFNSATDDFEGWNGLFWMSLTGNKTIGSVIDRDGNTYKTVRIGDQVWMAENLSVRQFNDGRGIPGVINGWDDVTFSARCSYDNDETLVETYGYLYNWLAVDDGKLCPEGWHVPYFNEWIILMDYLGGENGDFTGGKMKSTGTINAGTGLWRDPNSLATNESGFSGIPGSRRLNSGQFSQLGIHGSWWSRTEDDNSFNSAFIIALYYDDSDVQAGTDPKGAGLSVRCLKNSP